MHILPPAALLFDFSIGKTTFVELDMKYDMNMIINGYIVDIQRATETT